MALLIQSLVRETLRAHCLYDTDLLIPSLSSIVTEQLWQAS